MYTSRQRGGLFAGPVLFAVVLCLPLPEGMKPEALRVAALTVLMATWWISEAIPIPITALLPVVFYPVLGIMESAEATLGYGNHLIFLFIGGFILAQAIERWGLHRRIALVTIRLVGTGPSRIVLGFMIAAAFLSMWVSNTATTVMMVPIGLAVIKQLEPGESKKQGGTATENDSFSVALMLGICFASSIGGVGTLIETPPNTILAGVVERTCGTTIGFAGWMLFAVPLAAVMLVNTWLILAKWLYPSDGENNAARGPAFLASSSAETGLTEWIGLQLTALAGVSIVVIIAVVTLATIFLTEVTSNTATSTILVPVVGGLAVALQIHPFGPMFAAAIAASFAFMLPVATPPNAVVYGSGRVTMQQMVKAGIWLNLIGAIVRTGFVTLVLPWLWGIDLTGSMLPTR